MAWLVTVDQPMAAKEEWGAEREPMGLEYQEDLEDQLVVVMAVMVELAETVDQH